LSTKLFCALLFGLFLFLAFCRSRLFLFALFALSCLFLCLPFRFLLPCQFSFLPAFFFFAKCLFPKALGLFGATLFGLLSFALQFELSLTLLLALKLELDLAQSRLFAGLCHSLGPFLLERSQPLAFPLAFLFALDCELPFALKILFPLPLLLLLADAFAFQCLLALTLSLFGPNSLPLDGLFALALFFFLANPLSLRGFFSFAFFFRCPDSLSFQLQLTRLLALTLPFRRGFSPRNDATWPNAPGAHRKPRLGTGRSFMRTAIATQPAGR